jgi:hypothetical protein
MEEHDTATLPYCSFFPGFETDVTKRLDQETIRKLVWWMWTQRSKHSGSIFQWNLGATHVLFQLGTAQHYTAPKTDGS